MRGLLLVLAACGGDPPTSEPAGPFWDGPIAGPIVDSCAPQPLYVDADGDGYGSAPDGAACDAGPGQSTVPGDCDDARFVVNPGAVEPECALEDLDCDGEVPACVRPLALVAVTRWTGAEPDTRLGTAAALADLDGDGRTDVAVAASTGGVANAVWGLKVVPLVDDVVGAVPQTGVLLGDGDGVGRHLVPGGHPSPTGAEAVWLAAGDQWWLERLDGEPERVAWIPGLAWLDDAAVLPARDADGDGVDDVVLVGPRVDGLRFWPGPVSGELDPDDAPGAVLGEDLGPAATWIGDLDGDAVLDVALVGDDGVHLVPATGGYGELLEVDAAVVVGPGDLDGDGWPELIVDGDVYSGWPTDGPQVVATLPADDLWPVGDVQPDERADLWVGSRLLAGPLYGAIDVEADALWTVVTADAAPIAAGEDLDGDGRPDLVVADALDGPAFEGVVSVVGTSAL